MVAAETEAAVDEGSPIPPDAKKTLHDLASSWSDVQDCRAMEVTPLKGAMTNEIYQVHWPSCNHGAPPRKVLVRIYGEGVDIFFDRDDEIRTFEFMSHQGQGPQLLGFFRNGRVEEFINARVSLPCFSPPPPFVLLLLLLAPSVIILALDPRSGRRPLQIDA